MPWQDILTILNTIDTALGALFLTASWFGLRAWWRSNHAQEGQDAVGSPGSQDAEADEVAR